MKILKKILPLVAILAIIAVVIVKLKTNKETTQQKVYQHNKEKPILVEADTVRLKTIVNATAYTGTFEPNKETKISADVQGKINKVLVDVGDYINKGQALIQLDNSLLRLQLQSAEVQIGGLQDDVRRYTILTEADAIQGIQLEKAKLGLKAAQVQKASLLEQISKTTIRAPFSGVVTAKIMEEGSFAAPGVPLLQITDIITLRFTINVPENELLQIQKNQIYKISSDVASDVPLSGKVILIGSKANMGNSFPVQFQVANTKDLAIKSGMFGKVFLNGNNEEQGILIPSSATIEKAGKIQVYLIKNGKSMLHTITVSKNTGNELIVSHGLKEGDIIITNGFINLFENANVSISNKN